MVSTKTIILHSDGIDPVAEWLEELAGNQKIDDSHPVGPDYFSAFSPNVGLWKIVGQHVYLWTIFQHY